jgi:imidazolonepropionase
MNKKYIITNIGKLIGILPPHISVLKGKDMQHIETIENAFIMVQDEIIVDFGPMSTCPQSDFKIYDHQGKWLMPGFVDSHTHAVFASARHQEFVMRIQGKTYVEIANEGGGILNSAKKLREMDEETLYQEALKRVNEAQTCGTVVMEIKSGYGLSTDAELKILRVIKKLKSNCSIKILSTFLGAHAIPSEYKENRQAYIDLIINDMLPQIAEEKLADFMDVFCDFGFFTPEETNLLLKAAQQYGIKAKIHGNELGISGGVQVAVKNNALSVDHLEHIGQEEIDCLLNSETMPVALPGSSFFLKIPYTPCRQMIDAGLPVAIASDFNPGSSPHFNLWFTWSLACLYNGMLPNEGFNALTINAAKALGLENEYGSITKGKKAAFITTRAFESINEIPYWFGVNHCVENKLY